MKDSFDLENLALELKTATSVLADARDRVEFSNNLHDAKLSLSNIFLVMSLIDRVAADMDREADQILKKGASVKTLKLAAAGSKESLAQVASRVRQPRMANRSRRHDP